MKDKIIYELDKFRETIENNKRGAELLRDDIYELYEILSSIVDEIEDMEKEEE